ncbi:hypothetical protein BRD17_08780 [Halobacteriales archaeon SW_7_68_16]|nr:MAG: hypothetical protein BRD17_08780 [Halobacteriales archaeon SW_7_68_16]
MANDRASARAAGVVLEAVGRLPPVPWTGDHRSDPNRRVVAVALDHGVRRPDLRAECRAVGPQERGRGRGSTGYHRTVRPELGDQRSPTDPAPSSSTSVPASALR